MNAIHLQSSEGFVVGNEVIRLVLVNDGVTRVGGIEGGCVGIPLGGAVRVSPVPVVFTTAATVSAVLATFLGRGAALLATLVAALLAPLLGFLQVPPDVLVFDIAIVGAVGVLAIPASEVLAICWAKGAAIPGRGGGAAGELGRPPAALS